MDQKNEVFDIFAKMKYKVLFLLLFIMTLGGGIVAYQTYQQMKLDIMETNQRSLSTFEQVFRNDLKLVSANLSMAMESFLQNETVIQAFATGDRKKLARLTAPFFETVLKPKYKIKQFQFHLPPATSFLRVHKTTKFGDDLSKFRRTVVAANSGKKPIVGLEVGRAGPGLRIVYPVFYQGKHIGSVEFGGSISEILQTAKSISGVEYAIGIYSLVFADAKRFENKETDIVKGKLIFYNFSDPSVKENLPSISLEQKNHQSKVNNRNYFSTTFPLSDYSGREIGKFMIIKDITHALEVAEKNILEDLLLIFVSVLVSALFITFVLIRYLFKPLKNMADCVQVMGSDISSASGELSNSTQTQSAAVEEMSASLEELIASIQDVAKNANSVSHAASASAEQAKKGGGAVKQLVSSMEVINDSSKKITAIIKVITDIAEQTNLLALNAAIEAARAGEHGKGFAVVADEVRKLAERSATAALEITKLIRESGSQVEDGVQLSTNAGEMLLAVNEQVVKTSDMIEQISAATEEQAATSNTIKDSMSQISEVVEKNAASSEELASSVSRMMNNIRAAMSGKNINHTEPE